MRAPGVALNAPNTPATAYLDSRGLDDHFLSMSTKQLTTEALALPLAEKVSLAQALWQSIDSGLAEADEQTAIREAIRRDQELSSGAVKGLNHDDAMKAARRAIKCG